MLVYEISPYVRFAQEIVLTKNTQEVSTYDNRMFYVTDGTGSVRANNDEYKIQTGTLMLWKSGTPYSFNIEKKLSMIAVNFDYTSVRRTQNTVMPPVVIEKFDRSRILEDPHFEDFERLNLPIVVENRYDLRPIIERIVKEKQKALLYSDKYCSAIMSEALIELMRSLIFTSSDAYNRVERVIKYIESNYSSDIGNNELAKIAGYHPYHLNRLMRDFTQTTTHRYLLNFRLKKSLELLTNTTLTISEISEKCGFASAYYFSNSFKTEFGKTPSEYRRMQKNKA